MPPSNTKRAAQKAQRAQIPSARQIAKTEQAWAKMLEEPEMAGFDRMLPQDQSVMKGLFSAGYAQALLDTGWRG